MLLSQSKPLKTANILFFKIHFVHPLYPLEMFIRYVVWYNYFVIPWTPFDRTRAEKLEIFVDAGCINFSVTSLQEIHVPVQT